MDNNYHEATEEEWKAHQNCEWCEHCYTVNDDTVYMCYLTDMKVGDHGTCDKFQAWLPIVKPIKWVTREEAEELYPKKGGK